MPSTLVPPRLQGCGAVSGSERRRGSNVPPPEAQRNNMRESAEASRQAPPGRSQGPRLLGSLQPRRSCRRLHSRGQDPEDERRERGRRVGSKLRESFAHEPRDRRARAAQEERRRERKRSRREKSQGEGQRPVATADQRRRRHDQEKRTRRKRRRSERPVPALGQGDRVTFDGTQAKRASLKESQALFKGTGLDSKDRVRNRVARLARRHLKQKSGKSSSSDSKSDSGRSTRSGFDGEPLRGGIQSEDPGGALPGCSDFACSLPDEDHPHSPGPAEHLGPCGGGVLSPTPPSEGHRPVQRELLTLTHGLDLLLRGQAAASADTMTQRVKSIEQTLLGSHWTVA